MIAPPFPWLGLDVNPASLTLPHLTIPAVFCLKTPAATIGNDSDHDHDDRDRDRDPGSGSGSGRDSYSSPTIPRTSGFRKLHDPLLLLNPC